MPAWVLKLGGSLEGEVLLGPLLRLLAKQGRPLVIVPGGGRFADEVRARQAALGLDEDAAHWLAIGAMEQYAEALRAMNQALRPVADVDSMAAAWASGRLPLWLPGKLLREQAELPVGWQTTADSLALWFADHIGAEALILIKAAPKEGTEVDELAASGYVDSHFPELARKTRLKRLACFCIDELGSLEQALRARRLPVSSLLQAS